MTNGRIEVITSVERRRRWSTAEKQQLVSASLEPGASVSAVAREAGIHPGQLYGWRRQLGVRPRIGFAPVRIAPEEAPGGVFDRGTIEIEFATGARMRITGAADAATLTAAIAVLAEGRRR
jgi:Transposase and inactivated derivatives